MFGIPLKKVVLFFLAMGLFMLAVYLIWDKTKFKVDKDFEKVDLNGVENLMVVAHPDDDMLWGGAHLIKDKYLVVCVTCGLNQIRVSEFKKVMNKTGDKYIMLGYPDATGGKPEDWTQYQDDIMKDLDRIIHLKKWKKIVTHNPDGEYFHVHHINVSKYMTKLVKEKEKLIYFGIYYNEEKLLEHIDELKKMDDETLEKKEDILKLYYSQTKAIAQSKHLHAYENWIEYKDWKKA